MFGAEVSFLAKETGNHFGKHTRTRHHARRARKGARRQHPEQDRSEAGMCSKARGDCDLPPQMATNMQLKKQ